MVKCFLALVFFVLLLSGCFLPGTHLKREDVFVGGPNNQHRDGIFLHDIDAIVKILEADNANVKILSITAYDDEVEVDTGCIRSELVGDGITYKFKRGVGIEWILVQKTSWSI